MFSHDDARNNRFVLERGANLLIPNPFTVICPEQSVSETAFIAKAPTTKAATPAEGGRGGGRPPQKNFGWGGGQGGGKF